MSGQDSASKPRGISANAIAQVCSFAGAVGVVAFLFFFSLRPFFATDPAGGSSEAAFKAELDRQAPRILAHFHIPGMVVSTVVGGVSSRSYAYGYADTESKRPLTTNTLMRVASISKSVTAWGIVRLADAGKIDLDAPAIRYLGGRWPLTRSQFPAKAVTVRQLLEHTSGMTEGDDEFRAPNEPALSTAALLREQAAQRNGLVMPAGANYAYSVPGYTLLQLILERQTGRRFADYMHQSVLQPLGMRDSSYDWRPEFQSKISTAYADGRPSPLQIPQDVAADALISTGPDLALFVAAALPDRRLPAGGGVLAPDSVKSLFVAPSSIPRFELAGLGQDLPGLGCFIEPLAHAPTIVTNGGYDTGWSSQFFMSPSTGDGLVVVANADAGQAAIAQVAAIWSSWRGLQPMKMTRAYRILGVDAAVVVGLLTMMTISATFDFVLELAAGRRRVAGFSGASIVRSSIECALVLGGMVVWMLVKPTISTLPVFSAVATAAIMAFTAIVLARAVVPLDKNDLKAKRGGLAPNVGRLARLAQGLVRPPRTAAS